MAPVLILGRQKLWIDVSRHAGETAGVNIHRGKFQMDEEGNRWVNGGVGCNQIQEESDKSTVSWSPPVILEQERPNKNYLELHQDLEPQASL